MRKLRGFGPRRFQEPLNALLLIHPVKGQAATEGEHLGSRGGASSSGWPQEALEEGRCCLLDLVGEFESETRGGEGREISIRQGSQETD